MHYGDAIDEAVDRCSGEIQRPEQTKGPSGLFQALLGQAAKFRQPRVQQRPETLGLVRMDSLV